MIIHGLAVSRLAVAAHTMRPAPPQAFGNPMPYRPKPSIKEQIQGINHQQSHGRLLGPGPPVLTEVFRPTSSNVNGCQLGPAVISHYDWVSGLPLTPNAAASLASAQAPAAPPTTLHRPLPAPQPIVERNQTNGQLSRHAINHHRQPLGPFPTTPQFTAARPAPLPPKLNGYHSTSGLSQSAPPAPQLSNGYSHTLGADVAYAVRNPLPENAPPTMPPPNVSFNEVSVLSAKFNSAAHIARPNITMRLFVAGIPYSYSEEQLCTLFRPCGGVLDPNLWKFPNGAPAGTGSVIMLQKKKMVNVLSQH